MLNENNIIFRDNVTKAFFWAHDKYGGGYYEDDPTSCLEQTWGYSITLGLNDGELPGKSTLNFITDNDEKGQGCLNQIQLSLEVWEDNSTLATSEAYIEFTKQDEGPPLRFDEFLQQAKPYHGRPPGWIPNLKSTRFYPLLQEAYEGFIGRLFPLPARGEIGNDTGYDESYLPDDEEDEEEEIDPYADESDDEREERLEQEEDERYKKSPEGIASAAAWEAGKEAREAEWAQRKLDVEDVLNRAEDAGITFKWTFDDDVDYSWMSARERKKDHEVLICTATDENGETASMCGIFDPDDGYAREIEAEQAAELGIAWPTHVVDRGDIGNDTGYDESIQEGMTKRQFKNLKIGDRFYSGPHDDIWTVTEVAPWDRGIWATNNPKKEFQLRGVHFSGIDAPRMRLLPPERGDIGHDSGYDESIVTENLDITNSNLRRAEEWATATFGADPDSTSEKGYFKIGTWGFEFSFCIEATPPKRYEWSYQGGMMFITRPGGNRLTEMQLSCQKLEAPKFQAIAYAHLTEPPSQSFDDFLFDLEAQEFDKSWFPLFRESALYPRIKRAYEGFISRLFPIPDRGEIGNDDGYDESIQEELFDGSNLTQKVVLAQQQKLEALGFKVDISGSQPRLTFVSWEGEVEGTPHEGIIEIDLYSMKNDGESASTYVIASVCPRGGAYHRLGTSVQVINGSYRSDRIPISIPANDRRALDPNLHAEAAFDFFNRLYQQFLAVFRPVERGEIGNDERYDESISYDKREFIRGYIAGALWTSSHTDDVTNEETAFDHGEWELCDAATNALTRDAETFYDENWADLEEWCTNLDKDYESAGIKLWLNQNGHGSGFWDDDAGGVEDRLDHAAKRMGERELYLGDDDAIHHTGEEPPPTERGDIGNDERYDESVNSAPDLRPYDPSKWVELTPEEIVDLKPGDPISFLLNSGNVFTAQFKQLQGGLFTVDCWDGVWRAFGEDPIRLLVPKREEIGHDTGYDESIQLPRDKWVASCERMMAFIPPEIECDHYDAEIDFFTEKSTLRFTVSADFRELLKIYWNLDQVSDYPVFVHYPQSQVPDNFEEFLVIANLDGGRHNPGKLLLLERTKKSKFYKSFCWVYETFIKELIQVPERGEIGHDTGYDESVQEGITRDEFLSLKPGSKIQVFCDDGYEPLIVKSCGHYSLKGSFILCYPNTGKEGDYFANIRVYEDDIDAIKLGEIDRGEIGHDTGYDEARQKKPKKVYPPYVPEDRSWETVLPAEDWRGILDRVAQKASKFFKPRFFESESWINFTLERNGVRLFEVKCMTTYEFKSKPEINNFWLYSVSVSPKAGLPVHVVFGNDATKHEIKDVPRTFESFLKQCKCYRIEDTDQQIEQIRQDPDFNAIELACDIFLSELTAPERGEIGNDTGYDESIQSNEIALTKCTPAIFQHWMSNMNSLGEGFSGYYDEDTNKYSFFGRSSASRSDLTLWFQLEQYSWVTTYNDWYASCNVNIKGKNAGTLKINRRLSRDKHQTNSLGNRIPEKFPSSTRYFIGNINPKFLPVFEEMYRKMYEAFSIVPERDQIGNDTGYDESVTQGTPGIIIDQYDDLRIGQVIRWHVKDAGAEPHEFSGRFYNFKITAKHLDRGDGHPNFDLVDVDDGFKGHLWSTDCAQIEILAPPERGDIGNDSGYDESIDGRPGISPQEYDALAVGQLLRWHNKDHDDDDNLLGFNGKTTTFKIVKKRFAKKGGRPDYDLRNVSDNFITRLWPDECNDQIEIIAPTDREEIGNDEGYDFDESVPYDANWNRKLDGIDLMAIPRAQLEAACKKWPFDKAEAFTNRFVFNRIAGDLRIDIHYDRTWHLQIMIFPWKNGEPDGKGQLSQDLQMVQSSAKNWYATFNLNQNAAPPTAEDFWDQSKNGAKDAFSEQNKTDILETYQVFIDLFKPAERDQIGHDTGYDESIQDGIPLHKEEFDALDVGDTVVYKCPDNGKLTTWTIKEKHPYRDREGYWFDVTRPGYSKSASIGWANNSREWYVNSFERGEIGNDTGYDESIQESTELKFDTWKLAKDKMDDSLPSGWTGSGYSMVNYEIVYAPHGSDGPQPRLTFCLYDATPVTRVSAIRFDLENISPTGGEYFLFLTEEDTVPDTLGEFFNLAAGPASSVQRDKEIGQFWKTEESREFAILYQRFVRLLFPLPDRGEIGNDTGYDESITEGYYDAHAISNERVVQAIRAVQGNGSNAFQRSGYIQIETKIDSGSIREVRWYWLIGASANNHKFTGMECRLIPAYSPDLERRPELQFCRFGEEDDTDVLPKTFDEFVDGHKGLVTCHDFAVKFRDMPPEDQARVKDVYDTMLNALIKNVDRGEIGNDTGYDESIQENEDICDLSGYSRDEILALKPRFLALGSNGWRGFPNFDVAGGDYSNLTMIQWKEMAPDGAYLWMSVALDVERGRGRITAGLKRNGSDSTILNHGFKNHTLPGLLSLDMLEHFPSDDDAATLKKYLNQYNAGYQKILSVFKPAERGDIGNDTGYDESVQEALSKSPPGPPGAHIKTTYSIITPSESEDEESTEEHGWEDEIGHSCEPDAYDLDEYLDRVDLAYAFLKDKGVRSQGDESFYGNPYTCPYDGTETTYDYHLYDFTEDEVSLINDMVAGKERPPKPIPTERGDIGNDSGYDESVKEPSLNLDLPYEEIRPQLANIEELCRWPFYLSAEHGDEFRLSYENHFWNISLLFRSSGHQFGYFDDIPYLRIRTGQPKFHRNTSTRIGSMNDAFEDYKCSEIPATLPKKLYTKLPAQFQSEVCAVYAKMVKGLFPVIDRGEIGNDTGYDESLKLTFQADDAVLRECQSDEM